MRINARTTRKRAIFDGQSLNNVPATHSYPQVLMTTWFGGVAWTNVAVGGAAWDQLVRTRTSRVGPWAARSGWTVFVMNGGTTDLTIELDDAATLYADFGNYADAVRALGVDYVIATTITPSTTITGGVETVRQSTNALILADSGNKFDDQVDIQTAPLDDPTNGTYYVDGTHWLPAGADAAAAKVVTAMRAGLAAG